MGCIQSCLVGQSNNCDQPYFLALPNELCVRIIEYLSTEDIWSMTRVCQRFTKLVYYHKLLERYVRWRMNKYCRFRVICDPFREEYIVGPYIVSTHDSERITSTSECLLFVYCTGRQGNIIEYKYNIRQSRIIELDEFIGKTDVDSEYLWRWRHCARYHGPHGVLLGEVFR